MGMRPSILVAPRLCAPEYAQRDSRGRDRDERDDGQIGRHVGEMLAPTLGRERPQRSAPPGASDASYDTASSSSGRRNPPRVGANKMSPETTNTARNA